MDSSFLSPLYRKHCQNTRNCLGTTDKIDRRSNDQRTRFGSRSTFARYSMMMTSFGGRCTASRTGTVAVGRLLRYSFQTAGLSSTGSTRSQHTDAAFFDEEKGCFDT